MFSGLYDISFSEQKIKIKNETLNSPWITKGLQRSSKIKQKLFEKFLKKRNKTDEEKYKAYKTIFETLKKDSKKSCYSNLIDINKNNIKQTWDVMKEIIRKSKFKIDEKEIIDKKTIAEKFNHLFVNIGPKLASKIPVSNNI